MGTAIPVGQSVELFVDYPLALVHSLFLECHYFVLSWKAAVCYSLPMYRTHQLYMSFTPSSPISSSFSIRLYGVLQQSATATNIVILAHTASLYYKYTVADPAPAVLSSQPI